MPTEITAPIRKAQSRSAPPAHTLRRKLLYFQLITDGKTFTHKKSSVTAGAANHQNGWKTEIPARQAANATIIPSIHRNKLLITIFLSKYFSHHLLYYKKP